LRDTAAAVIGGADDRLGAGIAGLGEWARKLERLGVVGPLEGDLGGARFVRRACQAHRHGAVDEGLLDRMAVDAERKSRRHGDERDGDGEAHAHAPPRPGDALALVERRLQRVEAPLELGLVRAASEKWQQRHAK
jgi:hypothetical protein